MYSHKATDPDTPRAPFERTVCYQGKKIGRIHQFTHGPQKGKFWWTLEWLTSYNSGVANTKKEALEVIKNRHMNAG